MHRLLPIAAILSLVVGLWLGWLYFKTWNQPPPELRSATLLGQPRQLSPFALIDQRGEPFNLDNLRNRWSFLAIGYTHCPDVCPTMLLTFNEIDRQLTRMASKASKADFVFVSVDPERDTPDKLDRYVRYFNPRIQGATGSEAALQGLTSQLGMLYKRVQTDGSALGYLVDHSASILLIDPLGRLTAVFTPPHDASVMAQDFVSITDQAHPVR
jgi:protein SCO1/2